MRLKLLLLFLTTLLIPSSVVSQGTVTDYNRAYAIKKTYDSDKIKNQVHDLGWTSNSSHFYYRTNSKKGVLYYLIETKTQKKELLLDIKQLSSKLEDNLNKECLDKKEIKKINPKTLYLNRLKISDNTDSLFFLFDNQHWVYERKKNQLTKRNRQQPNWSNNRQKHWMERDDEKSGNPVTSPDGKYSAYIKANNIFIKNNTSMQEEQLSFDGSASNYYSSYLLWSNDSKKIAVNKIQPTDRQFIHYVESSPKDQLQPKLHRQEYTKPGDPLPFYTPCLFNIKDKTKTEPDTTFFPNPYQIRNLKWNKDNKGITFEYNQRGHQVFRVLELLENCQPRIIINETSDTFVNYNRHFRYELQNNNDIIWMSERDNWNHLYLYDKKKGQVKNQITKGKWYVRDILYIDEDKEYIYFTANGKEPNKDPYLVHFYRINIDGKNLICLTPEEGYHDVVFSPDKTYFIDTYSTVQNPPITVLRKSSNGKILMEVERADVSELMATGWKAPEVFKAKGRDNQTDMWGIIIRPSNFNPNKTYPIIEYIYAGPGSHYVPKTFRSYYHELTSLAELGFIVVQLDAMGTSFRSKSFENVCYKNLKDAGFPDRIKWIKAAAKKYPYMDINNIGIFGCSAGGQESTAAILFHPEFYKAAYSACGCHDNRMDKIWWNEQWMGYPIDECYKESSNVVNAHLLTRPLMLVVGEMDDNVDPASTYQLVNALIKANKEFELIVLPGERHTMGGTFGEHKRYDFFVRHLHKIQPPSWDSISY